MSVSELMFVFFVCLRSLIVLPVRVTKLVFANLIYVICECVCNYVIECFCVCISVYVLGCESLLLLLHW